MNEGLMKHKTYLYLTEFFSGMSVMAVELGASRLLAPYFSSSQIVWTIIIGTIMIAMALGNMAGGKQADRDPDPSRLYRRILIAAVWIAAIPVVGKYLIVGISALLIVTVSTNLLIWAALAACLVIFVYPLFLLGMVTPCLVKYTTTSLKDNGSIVGRLGACNTIGSIIGTFVPTFVTIPAVGTAATFLIFAGILLALGIGYFWSVKRGKTAIAVCLALYLVCAILGRNDSFAFWQDDLTYEGESVYNYLQVRDTPRATILSTNVLVGVQSIRMKQDRLTGMYYDYALAGALLADVPEASQPSLLVLGNGTGTAAMQYRRYFPHCAVRGVEIDERITELAHTYFALDEDIPVVTYDGRAYLNAVDDRYNVIMVDAYQDITIPFSMSSVEFFTLVKEHLQPGGVMVVNLNMRSSADPQGINVYLEDTIAAVFPEVRLAEIPGSANSVLFASATPMDLERYETLVQSLDDAELQQLMRETASLMTPYRSQGHLLTDDQAPVELLGMRMIDALIRQEAEPLRRRVREEGLQALWDLLS